MSAHHHNSQHSETYVPSTEELGPEHQHLAVGLQLRLYESRLADEEGDDTEESHRPPQHFSSWYSNEHHGAYSAQRRTPSSLQRIEQD